jgi:hypothetical protein
MDESRQNKRYPANWVMVRLPASKPSMGRLFDISGSGLKFFYNGNLEIGKTIPGVVSLKYLVKNPFQVEDFLFDMEIVWRKDAEESSFRYSYGGQFSISEGGLDGKTRSKVIAFLEEKLLEPEK